MERYYVTLRDAGRTAWLLGPYETHAEALEHVERGRELAYKHDPYTHFMGCGTAKMTGDTQPIAVFGV